MTFFWRNFKFWFFLNNFLFFDFFEEILNLDIFDFFLFSWEILNFDFFEEFLIFLRNSKLYIFEDILRNFLIFLIKFWIFSIFWAFELFLNFLYNFEKKSISFSKFKSLFRFFKILKIKQIISGMKFETLIISGKYFKTLKNLQNLNQFLKILWAFNKWSIFFDKLFVFNFFSRNQLKVSRSDWKYLNN